ncbi:MAG: glutamate-5-semialdehyde dehydrogenase [Oscillospiraceae bacterium]
MLKQMGENAKIAARELATAGTAQKNAALYAIAKSLRDGKEKIIENNLLDLQNGKSAGLSSGLLDRLALNGERIEGMADGCEQVARLSDPIGEIDMGSVRENGLKISRVRVPLGVIGIIYEARPNVTADAAALCLKSGNAVILRGGKEAIHSNIAIAEIMRSAVLSAGLPEDAIQLIADTTRQSANELMALTGYLDVLIPRGGAGLIQAVLQNSKVPVIETGTGNCHAFVDESADLNMAENIVFNAKCSRVSVCNALENLLVHEKIADRFLPQIAKKLAECNCTILGCEKTAAILNCAVATNEDYATEFLDYKIAVKVVNDIDEAISHIYKYSSGHSECIITNSLSNAEKFQKEVDAAAVYVNASTRFTDGNVFGFGAEIGISTQKLHARGPMGLTALTSMKYLINGNGQIR